MQTKVFTAISWPSQAVPPPNQKHQTQIWELNWPFPSLPWCQSTAAGLEAQGRQGSLSGEAGKGMQAVAERRALTLLPQPCQPAGLQGQSWSVVPKTGNHDTDISRTHANSSL